MKLLWDCDVSDTELLLVIPWYLYFCLDLFARVLKGGRPTGANYYNWLYFTQVVRKAAVVVGMQGSPGNHH